jgi:hypothetical protein
VTLTFEKVVRTKNSFVPGIKLFPVLSDVGTLALETKKHETIDVNNLHNILGHWGEVNATLTGKAYGLRLPTSFFVQLEKQGRKICTKNGKEEVQCASPATYYDNLMINKDKKVSYWVNV